MSLQHKLTLGFVAILLLCLGVYLGLDLKIRHTREGVNDKIIVNIYEHVRLANEKNVLKGIEKPMQTIAQEEAIITLAGGSQERQYVDVFRGLFLTMKAKINLAKIVILDKNFHEVAKEGDTQIPSCPPDFYQSDTVTSLCRKASQTWAVEGSMVSFENTPSFAVAYVIVDSEDNTIGYLLGFIPAKFLARTLGAELASQIVIQRRNGEFSAASDEAFMRSIKPATFHAITDFQGGVISVGKKAFLTHAIPLTQNIAHAESMRYLVLRDYTSEQNQISRINMLQIVCMIIVMILAAALPYFLLRTLLQPLYQVRLFLRQIADGAGDLTQRISIKTRDEIGDLAQGFNDFISRLEVIVAGAKETASEVGATSHDVATQARELSDITQQQAAAIEEVSSTIELMTSTIKQNAAGASEGLNKVRNMVHMAGESEKAAKELEVGMAQISAVSKKINDIIATVNEVAFQTNLLALNAAVEAARAGKQGKGFAVVADEVRALALRSAEAARQIKNLIEETVEKIASGDLRAKRSGQVLLQIITHIQDLSQTMDTIAAVSNQQASGVEEVNHALLRIDSSIQQNAATTEQLSHRAERLNEESQVLTNMVARFKVSVKS